MPTVARTVRFAAVVAAVEGCALVLLGMLLAVLTAVHSPDSYARAALSALFAIAGGALLLVLGRALAQARAWARSPVMVLQILALPVGYTLAFPSGQPQYGVPVLVLAAAELYLLFAPESRAVFDHAPGQRPTAPGQRPPSRD